MKVALANICPGLISLPTVRSILGAQGEASASPVVATLLVGAGPYLDIERNRVMCEFLDNPVCEPADVLLWVDSDIGFTPDDIHKVASHCTPDTPVVGGAYKSVGATGEFIVAYQDNDGGDGNMYTALTQDDLDAPGPELLPITGLGTGFMCIHRQLIEKMPTVYPHPRAWFTETEVMNQHGQPEWVGEDLMFCRRVIEMGHPVLLHRDVRLHHHKTIGLTC